MTIQEILIICFYILILIWIICLIVELILFVFREIKRKRRDKQWINLKK